ncbi:hypothetical protein MNB_SV-13-796 [hydrothermal vent metagenome]|uniref:Uncharacterized protein n=1 Tax=hydrothermal vent metagenome TaxID=652676 RepID=A0A1W1CXF4_9ZZZZ
MSSSFIIIDNDDKIETPLGLEGYQDNDSSAYNIFAISTGNYQNKRLSVNEAPLDFGVDLLNPKQKFITNYRTGSVMNIDIKSQYSVKGIFYDKATKKPIRYKAFKVFNTITGEKSNSFTTEKGEFTINQANIGIYNITFMRERNTKESARFSFEIKENKHQKNLIDLGNIYIDIPKKQEIKKYKIFHKLNSPT